MKKKKKKIKKPKEITVKSELSFDNMLKLAIKTPIKKTTKK
jgi:hypothetical protein